jgi:sec-independent protein translocase protein TatA
MFDYFLDIIGSEWIIIILVALALILGTNQLPNTARQLGRAISEFNKAKNELQGQMKNITNQSLEISGPVETERQKLEMIAKSLGISVLEKSDDELRKLVVEKMESKKIDESENKT